MIENLVNKVLTLLFGTTADGDRVSWLHVGSDSGFLKGRWWLHFKNHTLIHVEWRWGSNWYFGSGLRLGGEDDMVLWNLGLPFFSVYFSHAIPGGVEKRIDRPFWKNWNEKYGGYKDSHRYTTLVVYKLDYSWMDGHHSISWNFLKFDWGWSHTMPKWMDGRFDIKDFLFGSTKYEKKIVGTYEVMIPMPEGNYPAKVEMEYCTWKRPRLPWYSNKGSYANVDIDIGIPHEGKGENSWDCGEDALFGINRKARTVEEAIGATVQSVLESRSRYNNNRAAVYPSPQIRMKAVMALREAAKNAPKETAEASS